MKPCVEQLETRDTPSAVQVGGLLVVNGTEKADVITTSGSPAAVTLVMNNQTQIFSNVAAISIDAKGGDDVVTNTVGAPVVIHGGVGNDNLQDFSGMAAVYGEEGNDFLYGILGTNYLDGGKGKDVIAASNSSTVVSDRQDNVLQFFQPPQGNVWQDALGNVNVRPDNAGSSTIFLGGKNLLTVIYSDQFGTQVKFFKNVEYIDYFGGSGDDTYLNFSSVSEVAYGAGGNDVMVGGTGPGVHVLKGSGGNDTIVGRSGHDDLTGNGGSDIIAALRRGKNIVRTDALDNYFTLRGDLVLDALGNKL